MVILRAVRPGDIELICSHRERMFSEAGRDIHILQQMTCQFRTWLELRLASGAYHGFVAEEQGEPIGGVGFMVVDWPPHPEHPEQSQRGYVLNLYVEPSARRRGVASLLMAACEREFDQRGIQFRYLHATKAAMPLYKDAGWTHTAEMAKRGTA